MKSRRDHKFYHDAGRRATYIYREPKQLRYWLTKAGLKEEGKRKWNRQIASMYLGRSW